MKSPLNIDISGLIADSEAALLDSTPVAIPYRDKVALKNNKLPASLVVSPINVYALWVRRSPDEGWEPMYIGQRSSKSGWGRVRQHLFSTPRGTQSKLAMVRAAINAGFELGVTSILLEPDSIRLAVEAELIFGNTASSTDLPWNGKGRNAAARKHKLRPEPEELKRKKTVVGTTQLRAPHKRPKSTGGV
jgi:hypothetical protein